MSINSQSDIIVSKRDLYVYQGQDNAFTCQAIDSTGVAIDIQEIDITCQILEYENGCTTYAASIVKTSPLQGIYQIIVEDTTTLTRPRYVYSVTGSPGVTKIRFQFGQILVE